MAQRFRSRMDVEKTATTEIFFILLLPYFLIGANQDLSFLSIWLFEKAFLFYVQALLKPSSVV
jgi:hypothetical protein